MRSGFVELADGSALHYYDESPDASDLLPIIYHHGSPNVGEPPEPLVEPAAARGLRWIGYDRPGYGGSTAQPGRSVGHAAFDAAAVADVLVVGRPSHRFGQEVVAIVQPRPGTGPLRPAELRAFAAQSIARFKAPRAVAFCDAIARHPTGKPDYEWARRAAEAALPAGDAD